MNAELFSRDERLNARQIYSDGSLSALATQRPQLALYRLDEIHTGDEPGRYVDVVLYIPETDKLIFAIGLPVREAQGRFAGVIWPQLFAALGHDLVARLTDEILGGLNAQPWKLRDLRVVLPLLQTFGADYQDLVDERCCPGLELYWNLTRHMKRYGFVARQVREGRVLDVAVGAGYGASMVLGANPGIVSYTGADYDAIAIKLARKTNLDPRAQFHQGDFAELPGGFDWIVSLETIEHVPDPDLFLQGLVSKLAPNGRMLISLPTERWDGSHLNPHHWSNWNLARIRALVEPYFDDVRCYCDDRPTFAESPFDITNIQPYEVGADTSRHSGYSLVLGAPKAHKARRPRLIVRRRYARGDVLQATPIVRELRRRYPAHRLAVWTDVNEVFADNPHVDLLISARSGFQPAADDLLINLDEAYERNPKLHMLEAYAQAAGVALANPNLELYLASMDYQIASAHLQPLLDAPGIERLVAVHLGATPDRTWPQTHWDTLLTMLLADPGVGVIAVGAGNDFSPAPHARVVNLVNQLDFRATAAALAIADLVIGPDSALLHVAAAVSTAAVGLYGMADPDKRIPVGAQQIGLQSPVDCAGCLHDLPAPNTNPRCKFGTAFCYEAITPDRVYQAAVRLLDDQQALAWRLRARLGGAMHGGQTPQLATERPNVAPVAAPAAASQPAPMTAALDAKTYAAWLDKHALREVGAQLHAERMMTEWRTRPAIHLIVKARRGAERLLAQTMDSISHQLYNNWTVSIVADFVHPDSIVPNEILHWYSVEQGASLAPAINQALAEVPADWAGLMDAGDTLEPQLMLVCIDTMHGEPGWYFIYTDEDVIDAAGVPGAPRFKPDFNLDMLRSTPYVGHFCLVQREVLLGLGGYADADGAENHDAALQMHDLMRESSIGHIASVLYHRHSANEQSHDMARLEAIGKAAVARHLERSGIEAQVADGLLPGTFRVLYKHATQPLVSIIIPNKDRLDLLRPCVESLFEKTAYGNFEVFIVDNNSQAEDTFEYYAHLKAQFPGRVEVLSYPHAFNYSAMNNLAAEQARGEYLLLLNNDTVVIQSEWLERLLAYGQRAEVGVVGPRLVYANGNLQHAGVVLGMQGYAGHPFIELPIQDSGYLQRTQIDQNYSAVTGACLLIRKSIFAAVGGLDEEKFKVNYNDIDLCIKVGQQGYKIVWTPYATLIHHGSLSQITQTVTTESRQRFQGEQQAMLERWLPLLANDPAYNRNLSLAYTTVEVETQMDAGWDANFRDCPKILAVPLNAGAVGEHRVIAPLRALESAAWAQVAYTPCSDNIQQVPRMPTVVELERLRPDTLYLQSTVHDVHLEMLTQYRRFNNVFKVFDFEDLKTDVPEKNSRKSILFPEIKRRLRAALACCDRLTVTTEPLAEAYRHLIDDVRVVPLRLERARWGQLKSLRRQGQRPRVGWAGAQQHHADLEVLIPVIKATAHEIDWVFFGMCLDELRPYVKEEHGFVGFDVYPRQLAALNLDLAVAPLEHHAFNEAKTNLRLLEYGAMGWPVVCTDITPYQNAPVTRVSNDPQAWMNAIRERAFDLDAAAAEGDRLRRWVHGEWMLEDHLDEWLAALSPSAEAASASESLILPFGRSAAAD